MKRVPDLKFRTPVGSPPPLMQRATMKPIFFLSVIACAHMA
jgi:hypothetical protein